MDPFNLGPDQSRASIKLQILRYTADCWQGLAGQSRDVDLDRVAVSHRRLIQARSLADDGAGFNAVLLGPCTRAFLLTTDWMSTATSLLA
ncbi:hypothetical protein CSHISOI_06438 [Colletotrichum shisoi]|uniref:Uncharacterized protein n=1 Tax=Colletotrichum shisoi TaxID=2078593 RepID=A0A5Q4BR26_9PEZI|nr:hypothetical protein CSHISOI_06438 [Colletotrichum shisoi]